MRIGFDLTPLSVPQSGVGTYTLNLWDALCHHTGNEMVPLLHRPLHPETALGTRVPLPRWGGRLNKTVWMQALLPWQLWRQGIPVSHFTNSVSPLLAGQKTVLTIHDMTLWLFPEHHYRRRLLAMRPFIPLAARRAAAVVTVSQSARADIVRILRLPPEKVHVIHEAPAAHFRPLARGEGAEAVRARYGLPPRFLLAVGTIEPRKNLVRLLEAFALLRARDHLPHILLMVGARGWKDGPVFEAVERLGLRGAVRFLRYVPAEELVALYNLAEALAFPSLYEGFGLPVVEAMACGTPVVTSRCGSLAEVAGAAAEFVEPTEVESIAAGLRAVLCDSDHRESLRARGLAHVSRFTWARAAQETGAVYRELYEERERGEEGEQRAATGSTGQNVAKKQL